LKSINTAAAEEVIGIDRYSTTQAKGRIKQVGDFMPYIEINASS
jgi:hypothetical protein